jgi:hypothetical protein
MANTVGLPSSETKRVLFNNGGELSSDAALTWNVSSSTLSAASLILSGTLSVTGSMGAVTATSVSATGSLSTSLNTVPADGSVVANQVKIWFDSTDGAAKVKFKGKSADGTVVVGEVALT